MPLRRFLPISTEKNTVSETPSRPSVVGSKSIPSKEDSRNFGNLLSKTADPDVLTIPEDGSHIKKVLADVARVNAANAAKRDPEANWRDELENLERTVGTSWTEEQARQACDATEREQNKIVQAIETDIRELGRLSKLPYLTTIKIHALACVCDKCVIERKIESLKYDLAEAKKEQQRKIRLAGSAVSSSKERDKSRPRLRELRERAFQIDQATARVREATDGVFRDEGVPSRPNPGAHRPTPAG